MGLGQLAQPCRLMQAVMQAEAGPMPPLCNHTASWGGFGVGAMFLSVFVAVLLICVARPGLRRHHVPNLCKPGVMAQASGGMLSFGKWVSMFLNCSCTVCCEAALCTVPSSCGLLESCSAHLQQLILVVAQSGADQRDAPDVGCGEMLQRTRGCRLYAMCLCAKLVRGNMHGQRPAPTSLRQWQG